MPLRSRKREWDARKSRPGANVGDPCSLRPLRQVRQHGERIKQMLAHHGKRFANRGQVVAAVPFGEQHYVGDQLIAGARRQRELEFFQAALERGLRRHAVLLDGCKPLFKCTSKSEIAAGVMPEIREAWPTVSGLC